jgi:hypothetical protein
MNKPIDKNKTEEQKIELTNLENQLQEELNKPSILDGLGDFLSIKSYDNLVGGSLISSDPIGDKKKVQNFFKNPKWWLAILILTIVIVSFAQLMNKLALSGLN